MCFSLLFEPMLGSLCILCVLDFDIKTNIPNNTTDDRVTLDPQYDIDQVAIKAMPPINWEKKEETKIGTIS